MARMTQGAPEMTGLEATTQAEGGLEPVVESETLVRGDLYWLDGWVVEVRGDGLSIEKADEIPEGAVTQDSGTGYLYLGNEDDRLDILLARTIVGKDEPGVEKIERIPDAETATPVSETLEESEALENA